MTDEQRPLEVAILVPPGYLPIDVIPFHTALGVLPEVNMHLVWKNLDEISGFPRFPTRATTTFEDCPAGLDVLFAGAAPPEILEDAETLAFLADRGSRAEWVAGVCAGSLLMGAAGLLRGYRATANFHLYDLMRYNGATVVRTNRIVADGNRRTAGLANGSYEIALRLVQEFFGTDTARLTELNAEYAPKPPFGVGTRGLAGPELTRQALGMMSETSTGFLKASERAAERLGVPVQPA